MRERVTFPQDLLSQGAFFFEAPSAFDEAVVNKKWNDEAVKVLSEYKSALAELSSLDAGTAKVTLESVTARNGIQTGKILPVLRISITGGASGPDLMMTMEILGRDEVVKRIAYAVQTLKVKAL